MSGSQRGNAAKVALDRSAGPWKRWTGMARHARAIRFMETYCRAPKGRGFGQPIRLAQFQKEFLEEALADGIDAAILQTPRGNGKSSLGGALAVWAVFDDDDTGSPQVPIIATTISQAILSCYGVAVSMIRADPQLSRRSLIYTGVSTPRVLSVANNGELFPKSNDPDGLQGLDPSLAVVDEIGFQPVESWDSIQLAQGKRERSLAVGVGTPGLDRDNALYHIRRLVRESPEAPRGLVFHEFSAPEGCDAGDRAAWRAANPAIGAGFLQESALENAFVRTLEGPFRVFRLGQWVDGVNSWLGENGRAIWEGLMDPADPVPGGPTWMGLDVGIKRDSTALVTVQRRPDGRLHAWCRLWIPTTDDPVDITDVMGAIRDADKAYDLRAVSYDPRFFDVSAKMLSDEGLAMVEVSQSPERMTAVIGSLLEVIKRTDLRHNGDGPFTEQVLNAVPRLNERGFTLQKSKSRGRIDAVIALSLAVDRALLDSVTPEAQEPMIAWG